MTLLSSKIFVLGWLLINKMSRKTVILMLFILFLWNPVAFLQESSYSCGIWPFLQEWEGHWEVLIFCFFFAYFYFTNSYIIYRRLLHHLRSKWWQKMAQDASDTSQAQVCFFFLHTFTLLTVILCIVGHYTIWGPNDNKKGLEMHLTHLKLRYVFFFASFTLLTVILFIEGCYTI